MLQVEIFYNFIKQSQGNYLFKLIGSVRNNDDRLILNQIREKINYLKLSQNIQIIENPSYNELIALFNEATFGIHTMQAEHFGIGLIEMMSTGIIPIAYNQAGPLYDIIQDSSKGYLCKDQKDFEQAIFNGFQMIQEDNQKYKQMIQNVIKQSKKYGNNSFDEVFNKNFNNFIQN